jgi:hypothetical protein
VGLSPLIGLDDTDDAHGKHESRQKNEELVHVRMGLPMARCLLLSGGASLAARSHQSKSPGWTGRLGVGLRSSGHDDPCRAPGPSSSIAEPAAL